MTAIERLTGLMLAILLVTMLGGAGGVVVAWIKDPAAVERMTR